MKTAVFAVSSSLPPLLDRGGKLAWSTEEKASPGNKLMQNKV